MRDSRLFVDVAAQVLGRGCAVRFRADGWSMQPTIRNGETILAEPVRADRVRRGDILLYTWERGVRAHRVARIEVVRERRLVFVLRGDAGGEEERVGADRVLGKVVSLERDGRRIRLCGPAAFARRALRRSASRIKRHITNPWMRV